MSWLKGMSNVTLQTEPPSITIHLTTFLSLSEPKFNPSDIDYEANVTLKRVYLKRKASAVCQTSLGGAQKND